MLHRGLDLNRDMEGVGRMDLYMNGSNIQMYIVYWIVLIFCCCLAIVVLYCMFRKRWVRVKDSIHESRARERIRERQRMDAARRAAYKVYPNDFRSELIF